MKTLKIEKEVTKKDVYVRAESVEDSKEIRAILEAAKEVVDEDSPYSPQYAYLMFDGVGNDWVYRWYGAGFKITIPQLAELLGVEYPLKQLPTLEELIAEAKSKITEKTTVYPDWVDGTKEVTSYVVAGTEYMSEKLAIIGYISKRLREEYL